MWAVSVRSTPSESYTQAISQPSTTDQVQEEQLILNEEVLEAAEARNAQYLLQLQQLSMRAICRVHGRSLGHLVVQIVLRWHERACRARWLWQLEAASQEELEASHLIMLLPSIPECSWSAWVAGESHRVKFGSWPAGHDADPVEVCPSCLSIFPK